jgi:hypothetical protein
MLPLLSSLAVALDAWNDTGRATLTETDSAVVANELNAADAVELAAMCSALGWRVEMDDRAGGETKSGQLTPDFEPFRFVIHKPEGVAGPDRLVTNTALTDLLSDGVSVCSLRLVRCSTAFETITLRISPFEDETGFESGSVAGKPRRVVRESGARRLVTDDIGHWLLRDTDHLPWTDDAFRTWARLAVPNVMRALSNEVEQDGLVFRGPPLVRLSLPSKAYESLDEVSFHAIQDAAIWVYDNERELEMRHGLYSAEIARTAAFDSDAAAVFNRVAASALESARIAYGLNLSQVSRDSLRALADLRKAISDETAKLADSTRTIAGSVATSVFAGLGLLLARLTTNAPSPLVVSLTLILGLYVCAVIWSGRRFIKVQEEIRRQWRSRLYVFLSDIDYNDMVEKPAKSAEGAFNLAATFGAIITGLMVIVVLAAVALDPRQVPAALNATTSTAPNSAASPPPINVSPLPLIAQPAAPNSATPAALNNAKPAAPVNAAPSPPIAKPSTPSGTTPAPPNNVRPAVPSTTLPPVQLPSIRNSP